jgi:hypothetical protein
LFRRDLQQQWRKIWIATLALAGIGLVALLFNLDARAAGKPELYQMLFPVALIGAGLVFTSTIFADLHDPAQRAHFLTFPCSNLERFVSRYFLSGPLYLVYALIVYAAVDVVAALLANTAMGTSAAASSPFERGMLQVALAYFGLHALMFGGAIYFRSHALIKTLLSVVTIWFGLVFTQLVALRIFYWNYFTTLLPVESAMPRPAFVPEPALMLAAGCVLFVWVLYIAYQCLREQELQREL